MERDDLHLILGDHLALGRTKLANQRTMLAVLRTVIMLMISGVTSIKIFHSETLVVISGIALPPIAFVVAVMGLTSCLLAKRRINNLYNLPGRTE